MIDDRCSSKSMADHTMQCLSTCLDGSSYEHEVDYELFLFDLLETNEALLQPKASNDHPGEEREEQIFEEKETGGMGLMQEKDIEREPNDSQEEEEDQFVLRHSIVFSSMSHLEESMQ